MNGENYYRILGLTPDTATQDDIKANFRKLAFRWHPDQNGNSPESNRMFQKIREAYDTLSDPAKKREYDSKHNFADAMPTVAPVFPSGFGTEAKRDARRPWDGSDIEFSLGITFAESMRGVKGKRVEISRECDCPKCRGFGSLRGAAGVSLCERCQGAGEVTSTAFLPNGGVTVKKETCERCHGRGFIVTDLCPACNGIGRVLFDTFVSLDVPAGINTGSVLRVPRAGHAGHLEGSRNGDIYVTVNVEPSKVFHREGRNLFLKVKVPVETLILGGDVEVPLPTGGTQKAVVPELRPGRYSFSLSGHGMPVVNKPNVRGALVVLLEPEFPSKLTAEARKYLKQYAEATKCEDGEAPSPSRSDGNQDGCQQGQEEANPG